MTSGNLIGMPLREAAPQTARPRDELVTAWLLLLVDRGATYGYDLIRELDALGVFINPSIVYRTLRKLEGDRLLASRWTDSLHGPRRRSYRLTSKGQRRLDEIAGIVAAVRDLHDVFLREHGLRPELQRESAA